MLGLSIGTKVAWQIAGAEAIGLGHELLEPLHLLIGICSIEKLLSPDGQGGPVLPPGELASLRLEWDMVSPSFAGLGLDPTALRRAVRLGFGEGTYTGSERKTIARSPASRAIFSRAQVLAEELHRPFISLPHLLCSLLEGEEAGVTAHFLEHVGVNLGPWTQEIRRALSTGQDPRIPTSATPETDVQNSDPALNGEDIEIGVTMAADSKLFSTANALSWGGSRRLDLLYELPLRLAEEQQLESLLQTIVERLIEVISGAARGALLLRDRASGKLLLKAHLPAGQPAVSITLAQRAINQRAGFIWRKGEESSASVKEMSGVSGMYAPLVWTGEVLGVVCIDNPDCERPFQDEDLELLLAVARYAAVAVMNRYQQEDLKQNATLLSRLLTNFSPKLRDRLLARARHGKFRPGGEKSDVTILCSDIRGFTRISATMAAEEIVDMLNDYLPALVNAIFRFDGTIDKFIGDAILAVFGSPEPDPKQHENAIRAALEMQAAVETINARRQKEGLATCRIGIGVHSGEVLHGFIGASERMEFTVIGDAVNKASRYCDGAQAGETLISPKVHEHTWRLVVADETAIPTKHEGDLVAYRIQGLKKNLG